MGDGLYGTKQASKTKAKEISSSTSLAFSSNLASLISSSSSKTTSTGRSRPSQTKSDIFTAHNKNVKKRSAKDLEEQDGEQKHKTKDDIGSVSASELHRSKRRMEDKVRLYNAMKRGEYVGTGDRYHDSGLVNFDRKWAERQAKGEASDDEESSDNGSGSEEELVEYLDEFGRLRKGTKKQAEREERQKRIQAVAKEDAQQFAARPAAPTNVIYGDAIQHQAYNPDQIMADRMAEIAKKRDQSATPPPDSHFDASAEVRTKGTGFYSFSQDAEDRKKEMESLEQTRTETERARKEHEQKKNERKKEIEERKKLVAERRSKAQAEKFLNEFDLEQPP